MAWIASFFGILVSYLVGSIPTGYIVGKYIGDIDIREHGSKSIGATNVLRTLGKGPALFVLIVDILKGAAALVFSSWYYAWLISTRLAPFPAVTENYSLVPWLICASGLAVLVGHGCSVWLKFVGGKSAATGLGVLLAISPIVGFGAAAAWAVTLATFRIVSLSSIIAASMAIVLVLAFDHPLPYRLLVVAGAIYVIIRHRANVARLVAGVEPKLGRTTSNQN